MAQFLVGRRRAEAQRRATLRAIVAEVGVLAELLRVQYRPDTLDRFGRAIATDPRVIVFPIDPSLRYFTAYEGLSNRLGTLADDHGATIVQFYTFYKVAIGLASQADAATRIDDAVIDLLLTLADRIAAMSREAGQAGDT